MRLIMIVYGQIMSFIEVMMIIIFIVRAQGWKETTKHRRWKCLLLVALFFVIAQLNGQFYNSYLVVAISYIILGIIFSRGFLKGTVHMQILICFFPILVVTVIDHFLMQLLAVCSTLPASVYMVQSKLLLILGAGLSKAALWMVLDKMQKKMKELGNLYLTVQNYRMVNTIVMILLAMEWGLIYIIRIYECRGTISWLLLAVSFGLLLTGAYIGYSVINMSEHNLNTMNCEILNVQLEGQKKQIEEYRRASERVRKMRHDYKNHCLVMQQLLMQRKYVELESYLYELTGMYFKNNQQLICTNNDELNAIVNSWFYQCQEYGIETRCIVSGEMSGIEMLQRGVILSNILNNALEANISNQTQERWIELYMNRENQILNVEVKNPIQESVLKVNPNLYSTKQEDGAHGIGHLTVEETVEKIDGMIEYYEDDLVFGVHIIIPIS